MFKAVVAVPNQLSTAPMANLCGIFQHEVRGLQSIDDSRHEHDE